MKILKACVQLGLDLKTGISPLILVKDLEVLTQKRIVGNGSTIRRDNVPWKFFNLENIKNKNNIIGFIFNRYKSRRELIGELDNQLKSSKKRVDAELQKIKQRKVEKEALHAAGLLSDVMYSVTNVKKYL